MRTLFFAFFLGVILASSKTAHANPVISSNNQSNSLIDEVCKTSENPPFCLDFLHSDPRFANASLEGLAQISLEKAESIVKAMVEMATAHLAINSSFKTEYEFCLMKTFNHAILKLNDAKFNLGIPSPPEIMDSDAFRAANDTNTCEETFPEEPKIFKEATQKLDSITGVISAIAHHLSYGDNGEGMYS